MPSRPPRTCIKPGCRDYSYDGSDYCAAHKPKQKSNWAKYTEKRGGSRHTAGYDSFWDKLRVSILARDKHLCQACLRLGVFTEARHVDHIVPKALGGDNSPDNLQSLCIPCHRRKTQRESALTKGKRYEKD